MWRKCYSIEEDPRQKRLNGCFRDYEGFIGNPCRKLHSHHLAFLTSGLSGSDFPTGSWICRGLQPEPPAQMLYAYPTPSIPREILIMPRESLQE